MREWLRRPLVAGAVLLAIYLGLSLRADEAGYLGTDTGGKVATLEVMKERGTADPQVGYWAERWDPAGRLHPLYYTSRVGDRWVNVTTLPALEVAAPLYRVGGYRAALLVPMLGSVLAALAARSIVRRLGGDGAVAFWVVGLASPMTIYALDFWEHSLGVALIAWAVRVLLPLAQDDDGRWRGLAAGALFGAAGSMRTESFVYGAIAVAVICLLMARRRLITAVVTGAGALLSVAVVTAASYGLELLVLGQLLRAGRTTGTAASAGSAASVRVEEALVTAVSLHPGRELAYFAIGLAVLALLVLFGLRARAEGEPMIAWVAGVGTVLLYLLRASEGSGFVPGLFAAAPLAAIALAVVRLAAPQRFLILVAVTALPVVWVTQFQGGAAPQWGSRYLLASGLLLTTLALAHLDRLLVPARVAAIGLSVLVTAFGYQWLVVRSHAVADAHRSMLALDEPVLVSTLAHLPREGGAFYLDQRWLTATTPDEVTASAEVVDAAGYDRFGLVQLKGRIRPRVPGWEATTSDTVSLFDGVDLDVVRYRKNA